MRVLGQGNAWQELLETGAIYGLVAVLAGVLASVTWFFPPIPTRLLPLQRLRAVPWGGREVILVFLVTLTIPGMVQDFLQQLGFYQAVYGGDPGNERRALWAPVLGLPLVLALTFLLLHLTCGTRSDHLGWTRTRLRANLVGGYLAWLATAPVVLGLFFLLLLVFEPVQHLLEMVARQDLTTLEWSLIWFQAVVAAPVLEETLFRGVLQGWLRQANPGGHLMVVILGLAVAGLPLLADLVVFLDDPTKRVPNPWPLVFALLAAVGYLLLTRYFWYGRILPAPKFPDRQERDQAETPADILPDSDDRDEEDESASQSRTVRLPLAEQMRGARLAVVGSSYLFAVFHSAVWPSPPPLLLLALVLGWLAMRTQSLVPGVTLHALFNAVACAMLVLGTGEGNNRPGERPAVMDNCQDSSLRTAFEIRNTLALLPAVDPQWMNKQVP